MKKQLCNRSYLIAFLFSITIIFPINAQTVSCYSGSGDALNLSGPSVCSGVSHFQNPSAVAVDASGNVYVADELNHKIRKITPAGVVSTFAGSTTSGSGDGTGAGASFNRPTGVAFDASGNLYVADKYNHRIRKITPTGVVTTLAGSTAGYLDGTGTTAKFNAPNGLTVDASGNVYVAERGGHRIRKITSAGVVTTIAGSGTAGYLDGTGTTAQFYAPAAVAIDASGNLYVADEANERIRKITPAGVVTTFAGGGPGVIDGTGTAAVFDSPFGITIDASGNLYVADAGMNLIRHITPGAVVTSLGTLLSSGDTDGPLSVVRLNYPTGVAVDATTGNLFITDNSNHKIKKINLTASTCYTYAGSNYQGSSDGAALAVAYNRPSGLVYDASGNLYVAEHSSNVIKKITADGTATIFAGTGNSGNANGTGTAASFFVPCGLVIDGSGNLYVADQANHRIRKITPAGVVTTFAGSTQGNLDGTGTAAAFYNPTGLAIDAYGNIYVTDMSNHKIRKITPAGVVTTLAGTGSSGHVDGTGVGASFYSPMGIYIDANGDLFVADRSNSMIRKVTTAGVVTTYAGTGGTGWIDGNVAGAVFNNPIGITGDVGGNLYIAEYDGNRIRKISGGQVTTVAGDGTVGYVNGSGTIAKFNGAYMITMTPTNQLLVSDRLNHRLRSITLSTTSVTPSRQSLGEASLYPNPAHDIIYIESSQEDGYVYILNNVGEVVAERSFTKDENAFDVSGLQRGIYILKIVTEKGYKIQKFIKD